ncbi:Uncharacterised protein [Mycobacterium tuberculosis]|nr:Uncharacterised protein [Mycobacterium tuberculosis]
MVLLPKASVATTRTVLFPVVRPINARKPLPATSADWPFTVTVTGVKSATAPLTSIRLPPASSFKRGVFTATSGAVVSR